MALLEQQEREQTEAETYESARGDLVRLRSYLSHCAICSHAGEARQGIAWLKQHRWIAVAYSLSNGRVHIGYSGLRQSASEAMQSAIEQCRSSGGSDCESPRGWNEGCTYISSGTLGSLGRMGRGATEAIALQQCQSEGVRCSQPIGGCVD